MTSILATGLLTQTVDRKRKVDGTYTGGRFTAGSEVLTVGIRASVQPASGKHIRMLSQPIEGKRSKSVIVIYCEVGTFRTLDDRDGTPADIVVFDGDDYEVQKATPRQDPLLTFDVVLAVLSEA